MKKLFLITLMLLSGSTWALAESPAVDLNAARMNAKLTVAGKEFSLSHGAAISELRPNGNGSSWLQIHLYSFPFASEDMTSVIERGDISSMDDKRTKAEDYNSSNAVITLSVDKQFKVSQVDISVPGYGCTITPLEKDVENFLKTYEFNGEHITLKSKGSYACDLSFMSKPEVRFTWDLDISAPVFKKLDPSKK